MKAPAFRKSKQSNHERGVTIMLIALAMIAIMAMAALSIDVVTLYLANAEAQRAADAGALAAARVLSVTGITGDPQNSANLWPQACTLATQVATAVAKQNSVGGAASTVTVTYPNITDTTGCTTSGVNLPFGVNPLVKVKVQRTDLPTFFARIWGRANAGVSATATAEAFNSSNSSVVTNGGPTGEVTPVQPRCVKPLIVPNVDPATGASFVLGANGTVNNPGIRVSGAGTGSIGETFTLQSDCTGATCGITRNPTGGAGVLDYLPGEVLNNSVAVPSCSNASNFEQAIGGCDQSTIYQCGVRSAVATPPNRLDLTFNPGTATGRTSTAMQCLTNSAAGADTLDTTVYPYRINPGAGNPLGIASTNSITSSNSIITVPIYDGGAINVGNPTVTIVGFLQVFVNSIDGNGNPLVTVLNVTGCGDGTNAVGNAISGSSPVPVRLIQSP